MIKNSMEVFLWVNNGNERTVTRQRNVWNAAKRIAGKSAGKNVAGPLARRPARHLSPAARRQPARLAIAILAATTTAAAESG